MSTTKICTTIHILAMREIGSTEEPCTAVVEATSDSTSLYIKLKDPKHIAACPDEVSFSGEAWYFEGWAAGGYRTGDLRGVPYPVEVSITEIPLEMPITLVPASEIP